MTALKSKAAAPKPKKVVAQTNNEPAKSVPPVVEKKIPQPCNNNDLTRPLFVILGAVGAVIVLLYVYPFLTTLFGKQKEVFTSVEQLGQSHLSLEEKVIALQKFVHEIPNLPPVATHSEPLMQRMDAMEANQKKVEQELLGAAVDGIKKPDQQLIQTLDTLKSRLAVVESKLDSRQQQIAKIPETINLFGKLRVSLQGSKAYAKELQEARVLFDPQDQAMQQRLQSLSVYANTGVKTIGELQVEFKAVAKNLRRLSIPDSWPWYSKFIQRMRNLVVVRKNGEALEGSSSMEEHFAKIQTFLENDNMESALAQADMLPIAGSKAQREYKQDPDEPVEWIESEMYNEWRAAAEQRLLIEQSIPIMEAHALAFLLTGGPVSTENKGK
jgi:hypothetical protein